jgi:hypothetical protein
VDAAAEAEELEVVLGGVELVGVAELDSSQCAAENRRQGASAADVTPRRGSGQS